MAADSRTPIPINYDNQETTSQNVYFQNDRDRLTNYFNSMANDQGLIDVSGMLSTGPIRAGLSSLGGLATRTGYKMEAKAFEDYIKRMQTRPVLPPKAKAYQEATKNAPPARDTLLNRGLSQRDYRAPLEFTPTERFIKNMNKEIKNISKDNRVKSAVGGAYLYEDPTFRKAAGLREGSFDQRLNEDLAKISEMYKKGDYNGLAEYVFDPANMFKK